MEIYFTIAIFGHIWVYIWYENSYQEGELGKWYRLKCFLLLIFLFPWLATYH